ncbi:reverse transcriptase (RNA-dependent DNA polymerase) [Hirsutella rhossiliensis]
MKYPMPLSYADDILIYSESAEENVRQTEEVIRRLAAAGLQGDIKKSLLRHRGAIFKIGKQEEAAFEALKEALVRAPGMGFWKIGALTRIETDASKHSVGATALQQQNDNSWKPVAYFSKTLSSTETVWPIQDREFLAIIRALEEWRPELENIIADALSRKSENFETVRARDLDSRTMELVPNDRVPAEVLEETHVEAAPLDIAANSEDRGPAVPGEAPAGVFLVELIVRENEKQIPKEDRRKGDRIWVPEYSSEGLALRTALIREVHEPKSRGHPGKNKMKAMLRPFYYWPRMDEDLARYARNCQACQEPWHTVLVDGKDMPNDRNGFDYVWTFICKLSKLILTIPGKKTDTAERLAKRYYRRVFGHLGLPKIWLSDNGPQFISKFMAKVNEMTGTEHKFGSAYHAQTQGGVEITNQYLDQRLTFYVSYFQDD